MKTTEYIRSDPREVKGVLECRICGKAIIISPSGMTRACPRVRHRHDSFSKLKKKYPKQISVCPADKDLQAIYRERDR